jgi:hypothetical protein
MDNIIWGLVALFSCGVLFGREVIWWYFGITRIVRALENIDASLRQLPTVKQYDEWSGRKPARAA